MGIFAHPDDETLGVGGVFARYAAEGIRTSLVTATRGDRGRFHGVRFGEGEHPGPEALAALREKELHAAAHILGIEDVTLLGYGDGRLDEADPVEAVGRIVAEIRRVRPDVVLTFGPEGAYGHPDHIAICQLATAAVVAAAGEDGAHAPHVVSKLYYMATTPRRWEAYQAAFKRLVSVVDGVERVAQPYPEWMISAVIDTRAQWNTVWRAVTCHDSQVGGYEKLRHLEPQHHEALWGRQDFYRAMSVVNGGRRVETDLFEGLR